MGVEITGSGPCRRLKFNKRTGEIEGVEIIIPPEMEPCSLCYQLKIPRATVMAQKAAGQRVHKCDDCRLMGKRPKGENALPERGEK